MKPQDFNKLITAIKTDTDDSNNPPYADNLSVIVVIIFGENLVLIY